jgi:hypothetical protein
MQRVMAAKRIDVVEKNEVSDRASVEIFTGTSKTVLKDIANVLELQEKKEGLPAKTRSPTFRYHYEQP